MKCYKMGPWGPRGGPIGPQGGGPMGPHGVDPWDPREGAHGIPGVGPARYQDGAHGPFGPRGAQGPWAVHVDISLSSLPAYGSLRLLCVPPC